MSSPVKVLCFRRGLAGLAWLLRRRLRRGGLPIPLIIGAAVAVLGLAAAGFMFMQMQSLKKHMAAGEEVQPRGLQPETEEVSHAEDIREEPAEVTYDLGKFTANTSDGSHAAMTIALGIESFYTSEDWDAYQSQMEVYNEQLEFFNKFSAGEVDAEGKPVKKKKEASLPGDTVAAEDPAAPAPAQPPTGVILSGYRSPAGNRPVERLDPRGGMVGPQQPGGQPPTGAIPAGEHKEAPPPTKPEEVVAPKTIFEKQLDEMSVEVRDMVIDQINSRSSTELSSPEGKAAFKEALIEGIGKLIDAHYGKVTEVYLPEIVTG